MENILKVIKDQKLILDILNIILGVLVIILIILLLMNPGNQHLLVAAFGISGFMNITNGLRQMKNKEKKYKSIFFILVGLLIIFAGALVFFFK